MRGKVKRKWQVQIQNRNEVLALDHVILRKVISNILNDPSCSPLPKNATEVSLLFTTDEEIRILNRDFRDKDKATDVLSFPADENPHKSLSPSLGDIVISLDTAIIQAEKI